MKPGAILFCILILIFPGIAPAQVKITSLQLHPQNSWGSYSFPLIHSANKSTAAKINRLLQSGILQNEKPLADSNTVFEQSRYIRYNERNSTGQSGYSDIHYEVNVNNAGILSLSFYVESTGAYSEQYPLYVNFDTRTGVNYPQQVCLLPKESGA